MKGIILYILLHFSFVCYSQEFMTIKEIFNYDIGDIFHYKYEYIPPLSSGNPFPYFRNVLITDKQVYEDGDSVVYHQTITSYGFDIENEPYQYKSHTYTSKVKYTNIDSSFNYFIRIYFGQGTFYISDSTGTRYLKDTTFINPEFQCNRLINGIHYYSGSLEYKGDEGIYQYGQGLGLVLSSILDSDAGPNYDSKKLIYFKKGQDECGSDYLPASISNNKLKNLKIFPTPTFDKIIIQYESNNNELIVRIMDIVGHIVKADTINSDYSEINISNLPIGTYLIWIESENSCVLKKILKK